MGKKALKSSRNRHTGRINAYKQDILDKGTLQTDSRGRQYKTIQSGVRTAMVPSLFAGLQKVSVPVHSTVRIF